jgi:hypothetical protein
MMRWTVVPSSIVGAILVLQCPIQAQGDNADLPVSIERIRAALKRQPLLQIPPQSGDAPTFRIEVRGRFSVLQPIDDKPFDPTFGLPSVGELLMGGVQKIGSAIDYKRRRAERRARKEVDDALAAFCAMHECPMPDASK